MAFGTPLQDGIKMTMCTLGVAALVYWTHVVDTHRCETIHIITRLLSHRSLLCLSYLLKNSAEVVFWIIATSGFFQIGLMVYFNMKGLILCCYHYLCRLRRLPPFPYHCLLYVIPSILYFTFPATMMTATITALAIGSLVLLLDHRAMAQIDQFWKVSGPSMRLPRTAHDSALPDLSYLSEMMLGDQGSKIKNVTGGILVDDVIGELLQNAQGDGEKGQKNEKVVEGLLKDTSRAAKAPKLDIAKEEVNGRQYEPYRQVQSRGILKVAEILKPAAQDQRFERIIDTGKSIDGSSSNRASSELASKTRSHPNMPVIQSEIEDLYAAEKPKHRSRTRSTSSTDCALSKTITIRKHTKLHGRKIAKSAASGTQQRRSDPDSLQASLNCNINGNSARTPRQDILALEFYFPENIPLPDENEDELDDQVR